jgi:hypothetical protein
MFFVPVGCNGSGRSVGAAISITICFALKVASSITVCFALGAARSRDSEGAGCPCDLGSTVCPTVLEIGGSGVKKEGSLCSEDYLTFRSEDFGVGKERYGNTCCA